MPQVQHDPKSFASYDKVKSPSTNTDSLSLHDSKKILYEWDMVIIFPRRSGGESKHPHKYSMEAYINLMLGLRRKGGLGEEKDDIIQDQLRIVLKSTRCFLADDGAATVGNSNKIDPSIKGSYHIEEYKQFLEKEYKRFLGYSTPTTELQFCELVATAIAKRLQLSCGLTTSLFRSYDDDEIFLTIRADDMDLKVEASRIEYPIQLSNKPFSIQHTERNNLIRKMIGEEAFQESRRHLQKATFVEDISTEGKEPEMDPLLFDSGKVYQPKLSKSLEVWGHNEEADSNILDDQIKRPKTSGWNRFINGLSYISWDPKIYFAPFAPYELDAKFQPYFRRYPLSWDSSEQETLFHQVDRIRLINSIILRNIGVEALIDKGYSTGFFALHDMNTLSYLRKNWALNFSLLTQPIGRIRIYFGEKIALYFAWLEFYTKMLILPSIVGLVVFILETLRASSDKKGGYYLIAFSVFVVIWSALFTELWKRKNSLYNALWGVTDRELRSRSRTQFVGFLRFNPITNEKEMWYESISRRKKRIVASIVVVIIMILIVIVSLFVLFLFKANITKVGDNNEAKVKYGSELVSLLNGLQIFILNMVYREIAVRLNDWENHRTDIEYENFLITKVFLFQFVNSFASFFYIAFLKTRVEDECLENDCFGELKSQLTILFIIRIVLGNIMEVVIPYIAFKLRLASEKRKTRDGGDQKLLNEAEQQAKLNPYEAMESFDDYNEMVIQYGFITLFVVAFPLAPLLALVNNIIEIHVDSFKLCAVHRRPYPQRAKSIGSWFYFLRLMSNLAIITNCALLLFTSDLFDFVKDESDKWLIFIIAEHFCLGLIFFVEWVIRDIPPKLQKLQERHQNIVSNVFHPRIIEECDQLCEQAEKLDLTIHPNPAWHERSYMNSQV